MKKHDVDDQSMPSDFAAAIAMVEILTKEIRRLREENQRLLDENGEMQKEVIMLLHEIHGRNE